jgi:hypothetical protein
MWSPKQKHILPSQLKGGAFLLLHNVKKIHKTRKEGLYPKGVCFFFFTMLKKFTKQEKKACSLKGSRAMRVNF